MKEGVRCVLITTGVTHDQKKKKRHCIQSKCAHDAKCVGKGKRKADRVTRFCNLIASMLIECFAMLFLFFSFVHSLYNT